MIIRLKKDSAANNVKALFDYLNEKNIAWHEVVNQKLVVLPKINSIELPQQLTCVETTYPISTHYKLASNNWKSKTVIDVNGVEIGGDLFNIMAGPCSVENEDQIFQTAEFLASLGVKFIRGGAYKPRTSPYSFNGLGTQGLKLLKKAAQQYNLRVVTEVLDLSVLDEVAEHSDVLQVGSRNMHNFYMLRMLGKTNKPVLLKRGFQAKVVEWLLAAEYILSGGNEKVILCERGVRSFDPSSRNLLDLGVVPLIKELSHLPIIIDPSHGTGSANRVIPASMAAAAIGAHGVLVEVHPNPQQALSDSDQAITFSQFKELLVNTQLLLNALGKHTDTESTILNSVRL
ncbi:MAG: 3-deoxy-7-phosphoheptulonate synthase [Bacteroidota bacterium]